jgi:hypothetical protein
MISRFCIFCWIALLFDLLVTSGLLDRGRSTGSLHNNTRFKKKKGFIMTQFLSKNLTTDACLKRRNYKNENEIGYV